MEGATLKKYVFGTSELLNVVGETVGILLLSSVTASSAPKGQPMTEKPSVTMPGTVEKIIPPAHPSEPEKAQIAVEGGDELYREIRIENALTDENGDEVRLKKGAEVEITVEADPEATTPVSKGKP